MHWTDIERPFLAAKGFNTNLVQFLPLYHVIVSIMHVCSFKCTISHMHGRAPKTVRFVYTKNYNLWKPDYGEGEEGWNSFETKNNK